MILTLSYPFVVPLQLNDSYNKLLWDKYFRQLGFTKINVSTYQQRKLEQIYNLHSNIPDFQHAPIIAKYLHQSGKLRTYLIFRRSGLITLQLSEELPDNFNPMSIKRYVKQFQKFVDIINLSQLSSNIFHLINIKNPCNWSSLPKIKFGAPIITIYYYLPDSCEEKFTNEYKQKALKIVDFFGRGSELIRQNFTTLRIASKAISIIVSNYPTDKKQRKKFRRSINEGIQIAHGIRYFLDSDTSLFTCNVVNNINYLQLFIHYYNPLIIGGLLDHASLLPSLSRTWFRELAKVYDISRGMHTFLLRLLDASDNTSFLIQMYTILQSISIATPEKYELPSLNHPKKISEEQSRIVDAIKLRHKDELNTHNPLYVPTDENVTTEIKYGAGLNVSQIMRKIGYTNGNKTSDVRKICDHLVKIGILQWSPYRGPGARAHSKKYSINPKFADFKTKIRELLNLIFQDHGHGSS